MELNIVKLFVKWIFSKRKREQRSRLVAICRYLFYLITLAFEPLGQGLWKRHWPKTWNSVSRYCRYDGDGRCLFSLGQRLYYCHTERSTSQLQYPRLIVRKKPERNILRRVIFFKKKINSGKSFRQQQRCDTYKRHCRLVTRCYATNISFIGLLHLSPLTPM